MGGREQREERDVDLGQLGRGIAVNVIMGAKFGMLTILALFMIVGVFVLFIVFFVLVFFAVIIVIVVELGGVDFRFLEAAFGGRREQEQLRAVGELFVRVFDRMAVGVGRRCVLEADGVGTGHGQFQFHLVAFKGDVEVADTVFMGRFGRKNGRP